MLQKQKKNCSPKGNRLLISISVLGSAGPLRFLVNEEELVGAVIETALRNYAREGRLPVLGSDLNSFFLYPANAGTDAMSTWEMIGSRGSRNFVLCKKPTHLLEPVISPTRIRTKMADGVARIARKGTNSWKSLISFKISSH